MNYKNELGNWEEIILEPSGDTLPIGAITQFSGSIAPTNWLFCNGQAISRTEYSELFAIIGTHYGEGDGSTTFNLPDFIGRVPVGLDVEDPDFDALGDFGGEKTAYTFLRPGINTYHIESGTGGYGNRIITADEVLPLDQTSEVSDPVSSLQPYLVTNFIIKVKQSVGIVGTVTTNIDDPNTNAVPNAGTVKNYVDEQKRNLEPVILYENSSGNSGTITLLDDSSNYTRLDIESTLEGVSFISTIYNPNGKSVPLGNSYINTAGWFQITSEKITITDRTISRTQRSYINVSASSAVTRGTSSSSTPITKVIGYR